MKQSENKGLPKEVYARVHEDDGSEWVECYDVIESLVDYDKEVTIGVYTLTERRTVKAELKVTGAESWPVGENG